MTKENKQNEKPVHYEQKPDKDKPDYTPQKTYEEQSTDRRGFLKRAGTAVVVGLGGILFGKKALADGIDRIVGEEGGLKKVTGDYDKISQDRGGCYPERPCGPEIHCEPNCDPNNKCHPKCVPHNDDNTDFKKVTEGYDGISNIKCDPPGGPCSPDACSPHICSPCEPQCNPSLCKPYCNPPDCHPNCEPHS